MCKRKLAKYQVGDLIEEWFNHRPSLYHIITKIVYRPTLIIRNLNGKRLMRPKSGHDRFYVLHCPETGDTFTAGIREVEMRSTNFFCDSGWRKVA